MGAIGIGAQTADHQPGHPMWSVDQ